METVTEFKILEIEISNETHELITALEVNLKETSL